MNRNLALVITAALPALACTDITVAQTMQLGPAWPGGIPVPAGDVDGDGYDDHISDSGNGPVYSGRTGATFAYLNHGGRCSATGDCNADGHDDLVLIDANGATIRSGADGTTLFAVATSATTGAAIVRALPGTDLDGDGCSDVVLQYLPDGAIEWYSGRTGTQLAITPNTINSFDTQAVVGDWNGDGYSDLALRQGYLGGTVFFHLIVLGGTLEVVSVGFGEPAGPVGDLDGNGVSDTVERSGSMLTFFDGLSTNVLGTLPNGLVLPWGDLDGDGHDDFRYAPSSLGSPQYEIYSGATMAPFPAQGTAPYVASAVIGDIDADGRGEGYSLDFSTSPATPSVLEWFDPAVPVASVIRSRGGSGATSIGHRPRLHTRGHVSAGSTLFLDARGLLPGGVGLLAIGGNVDIDLAPLGAPGNRLFASLDSVLLLPVSATGLGQLSFVIPNVPAILGATASMQAAAFDPSANALGVVTSNGIDLAINN